MSTNDKKVTVREENMTLLSKTVLTDRVGNRCVKKTIDFDFGAGEEKGKRKLMSLKLYEWIAESTVYGRMGLCRLSMRTGCI